jgi:hypothetical protein
LRNQENALAGVETISGGPNKQVTI